MAYFPTNAELKAKKRAEAAKYIPTVDEYNRAELYREAARIKKNVESWSEWDLKKAYEDTLQRVDLLENEVDGAAFDILQGIKMNLKVFNSEKA
jgi:hypothetical protein